MRMDHNGFSKDLGALLRAARQRRELTQEALAESLDVSVQTISNLERGKTLPALTTLLDIAEQVDADLTPVFAALRRGKLSERRVSAEMELMHVVQRLNEKHLKKLVQIAGVLAD